MVADAEAVWVKNLLRAASRSDLEVDMDGFALVLHGAGAGPSEGPAKEDSGLYMGSTEKTLSASSSGGAAV